MKSGIYKIKNNAPEHVAILGLGPSVGQYLEITKRLGGRKAFCTETWGINAIGDVFICDRIFHLDDVRVQQLRADASPESNIASLLAWVKTHSGPIYTSRKHRNYPGLVEFPLQDVINSTGFAYFNSTAAYAVAYAIHIGVKRMSLFGMDFTYPNAHHAEKGRACVEFWLGIAVARGIDVRIPKQSSLMDACSPMADRLYGYDCVDVTLRKSEKGMKVSFKEKAPPTAAEIEHRYDHTRHPNQIVSTQQEKQT